MRTKLKTVEACRIARMDRQRFNEFVSDEVYLCAPATEPGRARSFDEIDVMALFIFQQELDKRRTKHEAANVACTILEALRANPHADTLRIAEPRSPHNRRHVVRGDLDIVTTLLGGVEIYRAVEYNVSWVREQVRKGFAEESAPSSEEDE